MKGFCGAARHQNPDGLQHGRLARIVLSGDQVDLTEFGDCQVPETPEATDCQAVDEFCHGCHDSYIRPISPHGRDQFLDVGVVDVVGGQGLVQFQQVVDIVAQMAAGGGDEGGDGADRGVVLVGGRAGL